MKKWNLTLFDWSALRACGISTDILVTDWPEKVEEKFFHKVHGLRIFSLPESRRAVFEADIRRGAIGPTDQRNEIRGRLLTIRQNRREVCLVNEERFGVKFVGLFSLFARETFCDGALEFARSFYERLGVDQPTGYCLSAFSLTQRTFVKPRDGVWIDYASFLRMKNGLLSYGEESEAPHFNSEWVSIRSVTTVRP